MLLSLGTGLFQPADVGLQRLFKHKLKQHALEQFIKSHKEQLAAGTPLSEVSFSNSICFLRNASVQAVLSLWNFARSSEGREIIKMV